MSSWEAQRSRAWSRLRLHAASFPLYLYLYHSLLLFLLTPSFLTSLRSGRAVISERCRLHPRVMTHTRLCTRSPCPTHTHTAQSSLLCRLFSLCPLSISRDAGFKHTHTHARSVNGSISTCRNEPLADTRVRLCRRSRSRLGYGETCWSFISVAPL